MGDKIKNIDVNGELISSCVNILDVLGKEEKRLRELHRKYDGPDRIKLFNALDIIESEIINVNGMITEIESSKH